MSPVTGIVFKVAATACFSIMAMLVKLTADRIPIGEVLLGRSLFGLVPVLIWAGFERQLPHALFTHNLGGHLRRSFAGVLGMLFGFLGIRMLPLADATAINYAQTLFAVVLAAILLKETIRLYRWSAVAVGFLGVLVIVSGYAVERAGGSGLLGAFVQLTGALFAALATVYIRQLGRTEYWGTIVAYYSLVCIAVGLALTPFGWKTPNAIDLLLLAGMGLFGGVGQVLMTQSLRYADVSILAPFDYLSLVGAMILGYLVFSALPTMPMLIGASVVIAASLFVFYWERRLGARQQPPPPTM